MSSNKPIKLTLCLFLLAIGTLKCVSSGRIVYPKLPIRTSLPSPTNTLPSGQFPAVTGAGVTPMTVAATTTTLGVSGPAPVIPPVDTTTPDDDDEAPVPNPASPATTTPDGEAPVANPAAPATTTPVDDDEAPVANPAGPATTDDDDAAPVAKPVPTTSSSGPASVGVAAGVPTTTPPSVSFFMHDILGGSHPSGRVVTGIVASSDVNNLPFSRPNNQILPINGGVPLNTVNGIINNNNAPLLVGLNGSPTTTVVQNSGNNDVVNGGGGNNLPFVSAGQLPAGLTLQQLMFGSITVVDNELTEGHELGSAVLGSAQGFYLSSSLDGTSHTLVLTAMFHGGEHHNEVDDTISFFGVHRTGSPVSEIVVVGGTGKYEDAKGYATIEALPQHDQHTTDGVETITQFNVYITDP